MAEQIIHALKGEHPKKFIIAYHLEDEKFATFSKIEQEAIESEYHSMVQDLNYWGVERLNNGLSIEENEVLFNSWNIYLILKGIGNARV